MPSKLSTARKSTLLGMPIGTAANRLRKSVMFELVKKCGLDICYRCSNPIDTADEMSIEHKSGWQLAPDPVAAFFNVDDIGFSHLLCNIKAGARPSKIYSSRAEMRRVNSRKPGALAKKAVQNAARDRRKQIHAGMG